MNSHTKLINNKPINLGKILVLIFLVSVVTLPRSYAQFKAIILLVIFVYYLPCLVAHWSRVLSKMTAVFYISIAILGLVWSLIGIVNGGDLRGILESLRLYVGWSFLFFLIVNIIPLAGGLSTLNNSLVISGILIPLINFAGILNNNFDEEFIGSTFLNELSLRVGVHDGYIQLTSHNIASLFFICGYLFAMQLRLDIPHNKKMSVSIALTLSLITAALSGRRALWICIGLIPAIIFVTAVATKSMSNLIKIRQFKSFYIKLFIFIFFCVYILCSVDTSATIFHVFSAFSQDDERAIQSTYLIDGFKKYILFGSGFGLDAGYLRSETQPWIYELTYHQLLYNFGLVGVSIIFLLLLFYVRLAKRVVSTGGGNSVFAFSLLVGLICFLVGTYSNPYLSSFDFLLFVAILPLLSIYAAENRPSKIGGVFYSSNDRIT